jgi:hypothetical protein
MLRFWAAQILIFLAFPIADNREHNSGHPVQDVQRRYRIVVQVLLKHL